MKLQAAAEDIASQIVKGSAPGKLWQQPLLACPANADSITREHGPWHPGSSVLRDGTPLENDDFRSYKAEGRLEYSPTYSAGLMYTVPYA